MTYLRANINHLQEIGFDSIAEKMRNDELKFCDKVRLFCGNLWRVNLLPPTGIMALVTGATALGLGGLVVPGAGWVISTGVGLGLTLLGAGLLLVAIGKAMDKTWDQLTEVRDYKKLPKVDVADVEVDLDAVDDGDGLKSTASAPGKMKNPGSNSGQPQATATNTVGLTPATSNVSQATLATIKEGQESDAEEAPLLNAGQPQSNNLEESDELSDEESVDGEIVQNPPDTSAPLAQSLAVPPVVATTTTVISSEQQVSQNSGTGSSDLAGSGSSVAGINGQIKQSLPSGDFETSRMAYGTALSSGGSIS